MRVQTHQPGETFAGYSDLEVKVCPICGVLFAAPAALFEHHYNHEGANWFCPNGHSLIFTETCDVKLQREREHRREAERRGAAERDLRRDTERRLSAQKAATTRARKRHAAGVCPCCHRSFRQVRAHMARMHPDYEPEAVG